FLFRVITINQELIYQQSLQKFSSAGSTLPLSAQDSKKQYKSTISFGSYEPTPSERFSRKRKNRFLGGRAKNTYTTALRGRRRGAPRGAVFALL
ncbi:MAG: hypothetical protein SNH80_07960, partial [Rikenellaceae bacterium]